MAKDISQKAKASPAPDGLDSLIDDRSVVQRLFREFDQIDDDADPSRKAKLAKEICREIEVKTRSAEDDSSRRT